MFLIASESEWRQASIATSREDYDGGEKSAALIMNGQSHVTAKYWMSTATTTTTTREEIKSKFIKKTQKNVNEHVCIQNVNK